MSIIIIGFVGSRAYLTYKNEQIASTLETKNG